MANFFQQVVIGLSSGAIYAALALALVLIYRASGVINFAQGEMAMFSTYLALTLSHQGFSYWAVFFLTVAISFTGGLLLERVVIRPVEHAPELTIVVVTIGLIVVFNGLATWIWGPQIQFFPNGFPSGNVDVGGVTVGIDRLGVIGVVLALFAIVFCFFRFTKLGLAMRAAALNPTASRLLGVRVSWMLALGWGLAAVLGAVAGMLAPVVVLTVTPNIMLSIILYAFAAAVLGGIESPIGAVVGGLTLGVVLNLLSSYVHFVTPELQLPIALAILLLVLTVRPSGIFGRPVARRV
jgi:branched-chain amino acid transport system permease protein